MKRPRQVDVAKLAGVSRATVSLVINGQADGKVVISEDTRNRVLKAVEELGYEPDLRAQALRSGDTKTIGLIIIDMKNPHYWAHADGIEQEARSQGYNVLLFTRSHDQTYIQRIFRDLAGRRIDGLIISGGMLNESDAAQKALAYINKYRLPVVEMCDQTPDYDIDCLVSDYRLATVDVMTHLFSLGHRRIGMVYGVAERPLGLDRLEPYLESMRDAGLSADENLIAYCGPTINDGYHAALKLLESSCRPTAIIAVNDLLAIGVMRAACDAGLQVPSDLSIVGFDDISLASFLTPRLTTVTKEFHSVGHDAVRMILERIQNPDQAYRMIHMPTKLVIRESTGPAPVYSTPV